MKENDTWTVPILQFIDHETGRKITKQCQGQLPFRAPVVFLSQDDHFGIFKLEEFLCCLNGNLNLLPSDAGLLGHDFHDKVTLCHRSSSGDGFILATPCKCCNLGLGALLFECATFDPIGFQIPFRQRGTPRMNLVGPFLQFLRGTIGLNSYREFDVVQQPVSGEIVAANPYLTPRRTIEPYYFRMKHPSIILHDTDSNTIATHGFQSLRIRNSVIRSDISNYITASVEFHPAPNTSANFIPSSHRYGIEIET